MYAAMLNLADTYRDHGMFLLHMGMDPRLFIYKAEYMQVSVVYRGCSILVQVLVGNPSMFMHLL